MLKKIGIAFLVLAVLLGVVYWFFTTSDEDFSVRLSNIPDTGVQEENYLIRSELNGNSILMYELKTTHGLVPNRVIISEGQYKGGGGVFVKALNGGGPLSSDDGTMAIVQDITFHNGIIEAELFSVVDPDASRLTRMISRAFIGLCFRISADVEEFECMYLRPENGSVADETRRNHAVQYISAPDWDFQALRNAAPEKFEGPANIEPGRWHNVRIEVDEQMAELYIDDADLPVLRVRNLKHGADLRGSVALWVGPGTNGFFRNLKITQVD